MRAPIVNVQGLITTRSRWH